MLSAEAQLIAHSNNAMLQAIALLARCLRNTGALRAGEFENALRETTTADGAERERFDYKLLAQLLGLLEDAKSPPVQ